MYVTNHQKLSAEVTVVAAVFNAMLQLQHLEKLTITDLPDIWKVEAGALAADTGGRVALLNAGTKTDGGDARLSAVLDGGRLLSVSAAAAALSTLDDCGRWLLQHHSALSTLQISTEMIYSKLTDSSYSERNWSMSWVRVAHGVLLLTSAATAAAQQSAVQLLLHQHSMTVPYVGLWMLQGTGLINLVRTFSNSSLGPSI